MVQIYVSIGSNIDRERHIRVCLDAMAQHFGELELSPVYESEAVGFGGDNFYNLVAGFCYDRSVGELATLLHDIENDNGRRRDGPRFSSRTLDIDILTYGDTTGIVDGVKLPRDEILENAFVLWPLADLAPDTRHPLVGATYGQLWQAYDKQRQQLWPIDFNWRGKVVSSAAS